MDEEYVRIFDIYHEPSSYSTKLLFLHYQLHDMRLENETCPEIERLKDSEFTLDPEEQRKQESLMEQEVIQVTQMQMRTQRRFVDMKKLLTEMSSKAREEIQLEIVRNQYLYDVLKTECWDSMKVKGKAIKVRQIRNKSNFFYSSQTVLISSGVLVISHILSMTGFSLWPGGEELPSERENRERHGGASEGSDYTEV